MTRAFVLSAILLIVLYPTSALAWLRPAYEDATVVERSELIVVARLKPGSIQKVPHDRPPGENASWEYHATLVISSVLKGKCDKKEIPVIIHYGLTPVDRVAEKGGIEILDTGNSDRGKGSLVKDAGQDNLWFLRKRSGHFGREPGMGDYGVVDPEDVQPLELKPYFLSYLARDPVAAVKEFAGKDPVAERASRYLDHLEVQRILKTEDAGKRYDGLLPFFLMRTTWNMKEEAGAGIVACGAKAGERLKGVFADPKYRNFRSQIIRMWGEMNYREIAPELIALLKEHDRFWAAQDLKKGWWNDDSKPDLTHQRQVIYGEVYDAVCTLRMFCDPKAKDVLELTRTRWSAIKFDNEQIVEECEAALRELATKEEPKQPAEEKKKADPIALMKMMDGFRKKLPPPQGLNEMNGLGTPVGTPDVDGEVHPDSHLNGVATRMGVSTKTECMILLTYLKDRQVKIRHIAAFALEGVVKAYPNGFPAGSLDKLDSDEHQKMVQAFVAGIEKLPK